MQPAFSIQRLKGRWAVVFLDPETGARRRFRLHATDRLGAEIEARRRLDAGNRSPWTVGRILEAYLEDRAAKGAISIRRMRDAWAAMAPSWADVRPEHVEERMCRAYAASRKRAAATVRYELGMIATALAWAARQGFIARAPHVWRPAPPERRIRHLTRQEFAAFLEAIRAPHARLFAVLAVSTAGRPSALLQLQWQQVDFDRGLIRLNPEGRAQTAKGRATVPMTDRARAELQAAWAARTGPTVIEHGGRQLASVKKAFQAASARCGLRVTPYMLRHTAAVWMAEGGVSMPEIAAYMGHRDSRTTERHYARFSPDYLRKAAAALEIQG